MKECHARLLALAPAIKDGMHKTLGEQASIVTNAQKSLLTNDPELQKATRWEFEDDLKVEIKSGDAKAYWAPWREFGTRAHSLAKGAAVRSGKLQDKGPHHPGERAEPYFFPIWRAYRKSVTREVSKSVNAAMKKVAGT